MSQALPLTYVVLSAWRHNKFWLNWYPRNSPSRTLTPNPNRNPNPNEVPAQQPVANPNSQP